MLWRSLMELYKNFHPELASLISHTRPTLDPAKDFIVQDTGDGPYLAEWNNNQTIPTKLELTRAIPAVIPQQAINEVLEKRWKEEPTIREQLDMLYDAMATLQIPKALTFFNAKKAARDNNPLP